MLSMLRDWLKKRFSDPQIVILWAFLIVGFLLIILLGDMLKPVFAGLVIAYLLEGGVLRLQRFRVPRKLPYCWLLPRFSFACCFWLAGCCRSCPVRSPS